VNDDFNNISDDVQNIFYDIGYLITSNQIINIKSEKKLSNNNINNYKIKTKIPEIIGNILSEKLKEIHEDRKWKYETTFISNNESITLINWDIYSDSCIIQRNKNNSVEVNKKYFRELWENRDGK
jgi:hypothetical protein